MWMCPWARHGIQNCFRWIFNWCVNICVWWAGWHFVEKLPVIRVWLCVCVNGLLLTSVVQHFVWSKDKRSALKIQFKFNLSSSYHIIIWYDDDKSYHRHAYFWCMSLSKHVSTVAAQYAWLSLQAINQNSSFWFWLEKQPLNPDFHYLVTVSKF